MSIFKSIGLLLLLFVTFSSCSKKVTGYYNYEVQALDNNITADGVIFIKSWGVGKKYNQAIEDAKRNAIKAVIFKGVPNSSIKRPLLSTPGAEQQHRDFFDAFFQKDGKYLQYVVKTSVDPADRIRMKGSYKAGVKTKIFYRQLQKELENAGIIKKFGL
jgi:hypothetical protein